MVCLTGELPGALRLLQGAEASTFYWGAGITVRHAASPFDSR